MKLACGIIIRSAGALPNGDQSQKLSLTLGRKFVSPTEHNTERRKRAAFKRRLLWRERSCFYHQHPGGVLLQVGVMNGTVNHVHRCLFLLESCVWAQVSTPFMSSQTKKLMVPLPNRLIQVIQGSCQQGSSVSYWTSEAKNTCLQSELWCERPRFFRIESIADDDMLVRYYTGFTTYPVVLDPC
jgi:hypothetical protein